MIGLPCKLKNTKCRLVYWSPLRVGVFLNSLQIKELSPPLIGIYAGHNVFPAVIFAVSCCGPFNGHHTLASSRRPVDCFPF